MIEKHRLRVQLLNGYRSEVIDDSAGVLVDEIMAAVSDSFVDSTHNLLGSASFVGTPDALGKATLNFGKGLFFDTEESWIVDKRSIRQLKQAAFSKGFL